MTIQEFSNEFDILYNNIMSNQAPGLNEYEKSVLLTQAQEALVLDIYNGQFNEDSFESTEEVSDYINPLIKQLKLTEKVEGEGISKNSIFYELPDDLWFITYESVVLKDDILGCKNGQEVIVKPITQDKYYSISKNPFRRANDRRVLRLLLDNKAELISKFTIESYLIRYLSRPKPIILEDLSNYGVTISGKTEITECELNPAVHRILLNKAVQLAKSMWMSGVQQK